MHLLCHDEKPSFLSLTAHGRSRARKSSLHEPQMNKTRSGVLASMSLPLNWTACCRSRRASKMERAHWHWNRHRTARDRSVSAVINRPARAGKCAKNLTGRYEAGRPVMGYSALANRSRLPAPCAMAYARHLLRGRSDFSSLCQLDLSSSRSQRVSVVSRPRFEPTPAPFGAALSKVHQRPIADALGTSGAREDRSQC